MKNVFILFILVFAFAHMACSMGAKHPMYVRDISKTFFWADEVKGTFVTQTCMKYKDKDCLEWKKRYLTVEKDWEFIRSSKMILINESLVLEKQ